MLFRIFIFLVLFMSKSLSYAELYPFPKDGKWGYLYPSGTIAVHPIYESAGFFIDGRAKVSKIGERGEYLYGFIDETGHEVIAPKFTTVSDFSGGMAYIKLKNKFAYVLKNGTIMTQALYDKIYPCVNGRSLFLKDGLYGYMSPEGEEIIAAQFLYAFNFTKDGRAKVSLPDTKRTGFGFIDANGKLCVPMIYECARNFSEGFVAVKKGRDWIFIDIDGQQLGSRFFEDVGDFCEGFAKVKVRGLWGCIDKMGQLVIPPIYKEFDQFSKGLAIVGNGEFFGYINKAGKEITPFEFTRATRFDGKLARVSIGMEHGFMNASGRYNLTDKIGWIGMFKNGRYRMRVGRYYGYYDNNAKLVIKPTFLYASDFKEDLAITVSPVTGGYKVAYINKSGITVNDWNVMANSIPQAKDLLYCIVSELPFYRESDPESRIVVNIKYGDILTKTLQRVATPIMGIGLKGLLYSVEYYNRPGFVFSEGLSLFSPPNLGMGIYSYFREKFGVVSENSASCLYNGPMDTTFFNGSTLKRKINKNIVEDKYFVPFMKVSESFFLIAAALGYLTSEYPSNSKVLAHCDPQKNSLRFMGRLQKDEPIEYFLYIDKEKVHVKKTEEHAITILHSYPKPDSMPAVTDLKDTVFEITLKKECPPPTTCLPIPFTDTSLTEKPLLITNVNTTIRTDVAPIL